PREGATDGSDAFRRGKLVLLGEVQHQRRRDELAFVKMPFDAYTVVTDSALDVMPGGRKDSKRSPKAKANRSNLAIAAWHGSQCGDGHGDIAQALLCIEFLRQGNALFDVFLTVAQVHIPVEPCEEIRGDNKIALLRF